MATGDPKGVPLQGALQRASRGGAQYLLVAQPHGPYLLMRRGRVHTMLAPSVVSTTSVASVSHVRPTRANALTTTVRTNTTGPRITKPMNPNAINMIPASRVPNAPHRIRSESQKQAMSPLRSFGSTQHLATPDHQAPGPELCPAPKCIRCWDQSPTTLRADSPRR